jgi:hypothetical protein
LLPSVRIWLKLGLVVQKSRALVMVAALLTSTDLALLRCQFARKISSGEGLSLLAPKFLSIPDNVGNKDVNQGASDFNRHVTHKYSVHDITKRLFGCAV